ncbi:LPS export ABC transporter permease LptF [Moraxella catarrhalis]|uniref:LPS export ABC transporter permease LptF n=1 Tax=Moraxella catarrhalis TaxID=480 RepID=UPI0012BE12C6|nr:LPS export ABC transporter permease LptF [Moraxella catarrhalis]MCG6815054.1 LPS export ABC transporter permease LptF [Moraxella catarrhalis]MPX51446.1 LPS export ABC transporter permease LptF [Moraxella catarrhalis]MPX71801.1 LPS export ABC transporter permease LptF [Moraxella catarrhalis]MPX75298.1 LPS export ABC transporter permease LptF [Moraxella catarrhalis]
MILSVYQWHMIGCIWAENIGNKINLANHLKPLWFFVIIRNLLATFWSLCFLILRCHILRRYMTTQVASTTALVLGFLVVILLGGRLIRYFGMAAEGGLNVGVLFRLIGYNFPYFLELILPLSFFIGLMLVFGRLYTDHEMTVMNASGISRGRVARLLMPLVVVLMCIEGWVSMVAKPWGMERATNIWQEQSVAQVFDLIRPQEFISSGDYHLYVGEMGANREFLKDVIIIQMHTAEPSDIQSRQSHQRDSIIFAKSATHVETGNGQIQLDLQQGRRYEVDPTSRQYSQIGFERYRMTLSVKPPEGTSHIRIEGVSTTELLSIIQGHSKRDNPQEAYAELGYRLSMPWLILLAILLATPLSYVRPRQGRWYKLVPAILIYVAGVLVVISLKDTITKGKLSPVIYLAALLMMMVVAMYLNYHQQVMMRLRLRRQGGDVA